MIWHGLRKRAQQASGAPTTERSLAVAETLWECVRGVRVPMLYWKAKLTGMVTLWVDLLSVMEPKIEWAGEISEMKAPGRIT